MLEEGKEVAVDFDVDVDISTELKERTRVLDNGH
jgi:hypothetical protein